MFGDVYDNFYLNNEVFDQMLLLFKPKSLSNQLSFNIYEFYGIGLGCGRFFS
jgi:hypothetical protein